MTLVTGILLSGCQGSDYPERAEKAFRAEQMNQELLAASEELPESDLLFFENGLEINGLGITYDGRPVDFDGCYYFPAIEAMTGVHISVD